MNILGRSFETFSWKKKSCLTVTAVYFFMTDMFTIRTDRSTKGLAGVLPAAKHTTDQITVTLKLVDLG